MALLQVPLVALSPRHPFISLKFNFVSKTIRTLDPFVPISLVSIDFKDGPLVQRVVFVL